MSNSAARVYLTKLWKEANECARARKYEVKPLKIRPRFSSYVTRTDENYGSADAVNHDGRHAYIFPLNSPAKVHRVSLDCCFLGGYTRQSSGGHQPATAFCCLFFVVFTIFTWGQHRNHDRRKKLLAITLSRVDSEKANRCEEGCFCEVLSAISDRLAVSNGRKRKTRRVSELQNWAINRTENYDRLSVNKYECNRSVVWVNFKLLRLCKYYSVPFFN